MSEFQYKAFISYSHRDERWATWLHRALESYRIPRALVGSRTAVGEVPARVQPVFRDRDELVSAGDLGSKVTEALAASENLVVICSPAAAASRWVSEEIREFTRLGRGDRIFCLIVDGEADESGSIAAVFPGAVAEAGLYEPLAADARKWADGKHLAKLKLVAGMLGLPLDHLRRRDLQKRRVRWALTAVGSIAAAAVVFLAISARMAAEQRRDSGESLVASKLTEMRTLLAEAPDPEKLERLNDWEPADLDRLLSGAGRDKQDLETEATRRRELGIELWQDGDIIEAQARFNESWALQAESYRKDRTNPDSFFQLGQAEYWIGLAHWELGDLDLAETAFLSYAETTLRLIRLQPENADWVLEMAYALTNLGAIENARSDVNPDRALQFMQSALDYNKIALVLDPNDEVFKSELGQSFASLADVQRNVCDLDGALDSREEAVRRETEISNDGKDGKLPLAMALTGLAWAQANIGLSEEARKSFNRSITLIEEVSTLDPDARMPRLDLAERRSYVVSLDAMNGRTEEAWAASSALQGEWNDLVQSAELDDVKTLRLFALYLIDRAWLANERGNPGTAVGLLDRALGLLAAETMRLTDNRRVGNALTLAAFRYWEIRRELPPTEIMNLLPDYRAYNGRVRACIDASRAIYKTIMLGRPEEAEDLVAYLLEKGYREAGFMQVCRKYYSC